MAKYSFTIKSKNFLKQGVINVLYFVLKDLCTYTHTHINIYIYLQKAPGNIF